MLNLLYSIVLALHNLNRWLVLLFGFGTALWLIFSWLSKSPWTNQHSAWVKRFANVTNLQVLLGLILYLMPGAYIQTLIQNAGWAQVMQDRLMRFFALQHPSTMLVAVVIANVAGFLSRRIGNERVRYAVVSILLILTLALILSAIPWPGSSYARPLLRWPF